MYNPASCGPSLSGHRNLASSNKSPLIKRPAGGRARNTARLLWALCTGFAASPATAEVEIVARAASDWMYHGLSETRGEPTFGLAADWQFSKRGFAGVEVHQAVVTGQPQRQRSVLVFAGMAWPVNDHWFVTGSVQHREFPESGKEWDFTEIEVRLDHESGWTLSIDYSPDYYEHNTTSLATELRYQRQLRHNLYAYAELGSVEFSDTRRFTDYRYGQAGLGASYERWVLDVSYRRNSEGEEANFGGAPYSGPAVVAQLSWRLR